MILVDANLLLYAEDSLSRFHQPAREWWDEQLSGSRTVCLCWQVINAFIRISTHPKLFQTPLSLKEANATVNGWMQQPCVRLIHATDEHWFYFQKMLMNCQAKGNLVSDAHLAALAMEHYCVICSTDKDFTLFEGLNWENPMTSS